MKQHGARVWLVNTGWGGGAYGTGKRISLKHTRAIIDAIHGGALAKAKTESDPNFGFDVPNECPGVPRNILRPRGAWADASAYDATARKLADLFRENFKKYESGVSAEIKAAAGMSGVPEDRATMRSNPLDHLNGGTVTFSGGGDALYERHLTFDRVVPVAAPRRATGSRPSRARSATCCRSAGSRPSRPTRRGMRNGSTTCRSNS